MSEQCEFVIVSRAARNKPLVCGRAGFRRGISRQLANASAVLCSRHARRMVEEGFQVQPLDPAEATARRRVEATATDTSQELLPLFGSDEKR